MDMTELSVCGAFELRPTVHADQRGSFLEWFRADVFEEKTGRSFHLAQANCSVSTAGTLRGIHFAEIPPSQAKYVTCLRGAIIDYVIDIRPGSPTYGKWVAVALNDDNRRAVYLSEGLGHAFVALENDTVVSYLCSAPYAPGREHAINPFDPELAIEWPRTGRDGQTFELLLSGKDRTAPDLAELCDAGILPSYEQVKAFIQALGQANE